MVSMAMNLPDDERMLPSCGCGGTILSLTTSESLGGSEGVTVVDLQAADSDLPRPRAPTSESFFSLVLGWVIGLVCI